MDSCNYDTIVLSGGSVNGILIIGALQYAYDNYLLSNIKTYIGTSGGAILNFLLIIGYTPIEIMIYLCTNQLIEKLQHFNIVAMINGTGALSFSSIYEHLEKMTIDKIGFLPTIQELNDKFGKEFICVTYNLTENKAEYISCENNPNLPCLIAIKMSSNLPLIFENFKYGNNFYIDGGVSDNFPIDVGINKGNKILGIYLDHGDDNSSDENIIKFIYKLMFIPISQTMKHKIDNASLNKNCNIIKLETYGKLSAFNFNISSIDKLELFSSGYQQIKNFF
jgi:NTE family protein